MALPGKPLDYNGVLLVVGDAVKAASQHGSDGEEPETGVVVRIIRRNVLEVKFDSTGVVWRCAAEPWIKI